MVEVVGFLVAAAPFVVAGAALLWLGWPAARAGVAALLAALAGAFLWPALDPAGLPGALWEGFGTVGAVVFVLFGGLLLYNVLAAGGAVERVSRFLAQVEPERAGLALLVVLGAAPFFESVTGFGVAVVISAPILLSAGFSPLRAAALASWGQLLVPWGALGVGTVVGAELADIPFGALSDASAWLTLPLFPVYGLSAVILAGGLSALRVRALEAAWVGLLAGVGLLLCSRFAAPELAGAAAGLVAVAALLLPRRERLRRGVIPLRAALPYAVLLTLLIGANVLVAAGRVAGPLRPLFDGPGIWLLATATFAVALYHLGRKDILGAIRRTLQQWLPVAGAIFAFILAGQVVAASGAAGLLAGVTARALGDAYPAVAPLVGALGGALTGSNAGSNALFMPLQVEAAASTDASVLSLAALQNVAGSQANLLAPQRLALAAVATGLLGAEARIARAVAPPVAVSVAVLVAAGLLLA